VTALSKKQEGERFNDCIRAMLRSVLTISKIADNEGLIKWKDFYNEKLMKNEKIKEILNQLLAN